MSDLLVQEEVSLANYTTLQVGGTARYLIEVTTVAVLEQAIAFAAAAQLPYTILGSGSNVFFADAGYAGVVIVLRIMGRAYAVQPDGSVLATLGAGEVLDDVVADTVKRGWWGLENLSHIPGTVGATPVQNVGAYGVEIADVIANVTVFDTAINKVRTLTPAECYFGYRDSIFKSAAGASLIVTQVTCRLGTQPQPRTEYADLAALAASSTDLTPRDIRTEVVAIRAQKFPDWTRVGTAGSFFTNPIISQAEAQTLRGQYPDIPMYDVSETQVKIILGYVLDKICQVKGYRRGNVGLSEKQALVLITYPGATADEVLDFAAEIATLVFEKTGIKISREVTYIANDRYFFIPKFL